MLPQIFFKVYTGAIENRSLILQLVLRQRPLITQDVILNKKKINSKSFQKSRLRVSRFYV